METGGEWYLSRDGQSHGPVTDQELRKLVELGHLLPTDHVWRQDFPGWVLASDVPGLLPPARPPSASPAHGAAAERARVPPMSSTPGHLAPATAASTDRHLAPQHEPATGEQSGQGIGLAMASYIMLLLFFVPLVPLVGLVIAIANVNAQPEWLATHYQWQWRTVAKGLLLWIAAAVVASVGFALAPAIGAIAALLLLGVSIWVLVRHVRGLIALNRREAIADVQSWGW